MVRYGVLGWPVRHSRSPAMHRAAYAALGLADHAYQLLPVPPEALAETVRALPAAGFAGANVTIPHKEAALALADLATAEAQAIGAANTLTFADGAIHAANTDAPGVLEAIGEDVAGRHAVVLGAGGSARAAVFALVGAGASRVDVWNRTPARAAQVAADLGARVAPVLPQAADVLVNATSIGLDERTNAFKDLPLDADALSNFPIVVDLVYRTGGTELLRAAQAAGSRTVDGLDVLVAQGALSFQAWTGRTAPRAAMRQAAEDPRHAPGIPPPPDPAGRAG